LKWVTRRQIRVNRTATAWLIRRFIDPQAEFLFAEENLSLDLAYRVAREGEASIHELRVGLTWAFPVRRQP
jgi:hypothetical protein